MNNIEKNKLPLVLFLLCGVLFFSIDTAIADIAIIVHPDNIVDEVDTENLMRLYLGKRSQIAGVEFIPVDQTAYQPIREDFYKKVVNKSLAQAKAYWSRMVFSGKGAPPTSLEGAIEMKEWVSKTPLGVGYIDTREVDDSVKVVLVVK
ncbi:MAG: hypothetical protein KUG82_10730 [Pseudomonadales bacterium]|nr:hypothetical protein [Pseudomonadales bacterium]